MEDSRWDQVKNNLFLAYDKGMTCIIAALKPYDKVGLLGEQINDLTLSLITPLGAYHHDVCHV
jgi:hypothetical protein